MTLADHIGTKTAEQVRETIAKIKGARLPDGASVTLV
jgi:hypothetical protein